MPGAKSVAGAVDSVVVVPAPMLEMVDEAGAEVLVPVVGGLKSTFFAYSAFAGSEICGMDVDVEEGGGKDVADVSLGVPVCASVAAKP